MPSLLLGPGVGQPLRGARDFLHRFPNSFYAADARMRLDMLEREARARQLDRERAARERELRDRLAAVEVERLQAEMNLRAAERAAQDATERLGQEQAERERLAAEVVSLLCGWHHARPT
jgi:hypothetical protein